MQALASGGHRGQAQPGTLEHGTGGERHLAAFLQAHAGAGVQVNDQPIGLGCVAVERESGRPREHCCRKAPLRYMQFDAGHLAEPDQRRFVLNQRIGERALVVSNASPRHPIGRAGIEVLGEERLARGAVRPALARHRAASK